MLPPYVVLSGLAMVAFAANSLLCRAALIASEIDPVSFTSIRLLSGAVMLSIIVFSTRSKDKNDSSLAGSWLSALALFVYAAAFSFAYIKLTTATGALILFGSVQISMLVFAYVKGERMGVLQKLGSLAAAAGLLLLLLPGLSSPPLTSAVLMMVAGLAWAIYTLRGRVEGDPTASTMGNFVRSVPLVLLMIGIDLVASNIGGANFELDSSGVILAVLSGAIASGVGYAIWYSALPFLKASSAAVMQLSVPVIAALAGAVFLSEPITARLLICSLVILGGIALVVSQAKQPNS